MKLAVTLLEVDDSVVRTALTHELAEGEVVTDTIDDRPACSCAGSISPSAGSPTPSGAVQGLASLAND